MVPRWIYRLMVQERVRTRMPPSRLDSATCVADLLVVFDEIPYNSGKRVVCVNYEKARGVSKMPSTKYCPTCPYNTDNLRREADRKLADSIATALARD